MLHNVTIDGRKAILWLIEPDWTKGFSIRVDWPREGMETLNRKEYRQQRGAMRLTIRGSWLLNGAEYGNLKDWLGNTFFGDGSLDVTPLHEWIIAMPIWPDAGQYARDGSAAFRSDFYVDFTTSVVAGPLDPTGNDVAPLAFMRLKSRPKVTGILDGLWECSIDLESVHSDGVDFAPAADASASWPVAIEPDVSRGVAESSDDTLEADWVGRSRDPQLSGTEGFSLWVEAADFALWGRSEILPFLAFIKGHVTDAFTVPLWMKPNEVPTTNKPHALQVFLDEKPIELEWLDPDTCRTTLVFVQDMWDLEGSEPLNWFVSLTRDGETRYFVDAETDVAGWTSAGIEIDVDSDGMESKVLVRLASAVASPLFADDLTLRVPVSLEIHIGRGSTLEELVFAGLVREVITEKGVYEMEAEICPERQIPGAYFSRTDNLGLAEPGRASLASLQESFSLTDPDGREFSGLDITRPTLTDPDGNPADPWAGGTFKAGSGWSAQVRRILKSSGATGSVTLTLDQPVTITGTQTVTVTRGYHGSYWEAQAAGHGATFSGFPFIPDHVDELPYRAPRTGK